MSDAIFIVLCTRSVAGIFKEVATIGLSTLVFHDQLTPINISGLCVALFGIALYNYLKFRNYQATEKNVLSGQSRSVELHQQNGRSVQVSLLGSVSHPDAVVCSAYQQTTSARAMDEDNGQFRLVGEDDEESDREDDLDADAVSLRSVRTAHLPAGHSGGSSRRTSPSHVHGRDSRDDYLSEPTVINAYDAKQATPVSPVDREQALLDLDDAPLRQSAGTEMR